MILEQSIYASGGRLAKYDALANVAFLHAVNISICPGVILGQPTSCMGRSMAKHAVFAQGQMTAFLVV